MAAWRPGRRRPRRRAQRDGRPWPCCCCAPAGGSTASCWPPCARGWPPLSPAQSLVFAHLDRAGTAPSELARRLGTTRQAAGELVAGLCRADLLAVVDDPDRRGRRLVVLTAAGTRLAADAAAHLAVLEERFGAPRAAALRALLEPGTPPGG